MIISTLALSLTSSPSRIVKLGNDCLTLCLSYSVTGPTLCHTITNIPSAPNSTIDAGYFVVPSCMNESMGYITAKTKYQNVLVGPAYGLNGTIWRMDMDLMYQDIITFVLPRPKFCSKIYLGVLLIIGTCINFYSYYGVGLSLARNIFDNIYNVARFHIIL